MQYLKEVTVWDTPVQNHTYIVNNDGNLAGYIKQGTTEEIIFSTPMTGILVIAAIIPGKCADPPAPAIITEILLFSAFFA